LTGVPAALAGVVMRAVEDDIEARYPSAQEFAVALAGAAAEVFDTSWPSRSGLVLRVDSAVREVATGGASFPSQPTVRLQDARCPVPSDAAGNGAGDRRPAASGLLVPARLGVEVNGPGPTDPLLRPPPVVAGPAGEEEPSLPAAVDSPGGDADRVGIAAGHDFHAGSSVTPPTDSAARRWRRPLAVGGCLTALLVAVVVPVVMLIGPRSPVITTVAGAAWFTGDGGPATQAQLANPTGIAVDHTGTLYITDFGNNRVRRVGTDRKIITIAGTGIPGFAGDGGPAIHARLTNPAAVTVDSTGVLYIADAGNNRVRRVGIDGMITTVVGTGTAGYSGDGGPATQAQLVSLVGVAVDSTGVLYIADEGNHRVRRVGTDGTITTVAGTGIPGYAGDGGPATQAQLAHPSGVAVDGTGILYIADQFNDRVRRVGADGTITTAAGTGSSGFAGDGKPATQAQLARPTGVAVDSIGALYIADQFNNRVRRVGINGTITTVAGTNTAGYSGDGGPATRAQLTSPAGAAVDSSGALYITDFGNNRVRRAGTNGTITTVAGTGTARFAGDGGPATRAQLANPDGVAVDGTGAIYIAEYGNNRVRRVGADGTITTVAGTSISGFAGDGGPATQAQLAHPTGVAVDSTGALYIADQFNNRVRRVGADGTITTAVGTGIPGFAGDTGPATQAQLANPIGVAVDGTGVLYIAEFGNNRVRRVGTDGTITTVAGTNTAGYSGDGGPATRAQLTSPAGVAVDRSGALYITEFGNNRVRRVGTDGTITTVAGTGIPGYSGDGGPATQAQLANPAGVAVDSAGILYIAEFGNNRVRRVGADGTITTMAGDGISGFAGDGGPATHAHLANPAGVALDRTGILYITDWSNQRVRRVNTRSR
jgi:sugar lactone lactonase YvrE